MSKKLATLVLGLALATSPALASAQTTDQTISGLMARVRELQAIILQMQASRTTSSSTIPPPPTTSCVNLTTNMHTRSTDAETNGQVTLLQNYLIANGYMTGPATGYFGRATTHAVGQLQLSLGIASSAADPSYGFMGPRTRGAISCTGRGSLSAIPSSGRAPLTVQFSASPVSPIVAYGLDFGDGTLVNNFQVTCETDGRCPSGFSVSHSYTTSGTYTATLTDNTGKRLGGATIVVTSGDTTAASAIIDPRSLFTTSNHPVIYGTAKNVSTIGLSVSKGGDKFDGTGTFSVVNGQWSVTLNNQTYTPGTYGIDVFDANNVPLTHGTLTVSAPGGISPDGSSITAGSGGSLTTADGTWTFSTETNSFGNLILLKGTQAGNGSGTTLLVAEGGHMFTKNTSGLWYEWTGGNPGWTSSSNPTPIPPPTGVPTATLTANGQSEIWVASLGESLKYEWHSTNAVSAGSAYTQDSADTCPATSGTTGPFGLKATTLNGSYHSGLVPLCRAGHTYTVTYTVTGANNQTKSDLVIIHVTNLAGLSASPNPCTITNNGQTNNDGVPSCTSNISWTAAAGQTVQVWANDAGQPADFFACTAGGDSKDAPWITATGQVIKIYRTSNCNVTDINGKIIDHSINVTGVAS